MGDNTRVELDVRDNTRGVKPRGSLSGTLRGIPGGGERGPRVTRGHRRGGRYVRTQIHATRGLKSTRDTWTQIHAWICWSSKELTLLK